MGSTAVLIVVRTCVVFRGLFARVRAPRRRGPELNFTRKYCDHVWRVGGPNFYTLFVRMKKFYFIQAPDSLVAGDFNGTL